MAGQQKHLGTFAGGALMFVRELLQGEGIAHREEPLAGHDGEARREIWIDATEHDRALALLAAAQADAEAAANRETALVTAEEWRAAAEAARAAEQAKHAAAVEAHRQARRAAKEARRQERRRPWLALRRSPALASDEHKRPRMTALRIAGGALVVMIVFITLTMLIGERWGTHAPTPGQHTTIPCNRKYDALCVPR